MSVSPNALLWIAIAAQPVASIPQRPPDVEVVGQLQNLNYEVIDDPEDILGHGWITARLRISRVSRGRMSSRQIIIRYLSHAYRVEGSAVRLRLRANANGTFTVCAEPGGEGLTCG